MASFSGPNHLFFLSFLRKVDCLLPRRLPGVVNLRAREGGKAKTRESATSSKSLAFDRDQNAKNEAPEGKACPPLFNSLLTAQS